MDASSFLASITRRIKATLYFSGTLTPIDYYVHTLGGSEEDATLMLPSPFPKERFNDIFLRGSATKSEDKYKTLEINGLRMLPQEIWLSKKLTLRLFNDKNV